MSTERQVTPSRRSTPRAWPVTSSASPLARSEPVGPVPQETVSLGRGVRGESRFRSIPGLSAVDSKCWRLPVAYPARAGSPNRHLDTRQRSSCLQLRETGREAECAPARFMTLDIPESGVDSHYERRSRVQIRGRRCFRARYSGALVISALARAAVPLSPPAIRTLPFCSSVAV